MESPPQHLPFPLPAPTNLHTALGSPLSSSVHSRVVDSSICSVTASSLCPGFPFSSHKSLNVLGYIIGGDPLRARLSFHWEQAGRSPD